MKKISIITSSLLLATNSLFAWTNGNTITVVDCGSVDSCIEDTYTYGSNAKYQDSGFSVTNGGIDYYFVKSTQESDVAYPCRAGKGTGSTGETCTELNEDWFTKMGIDYGQDSTPPVTSSPSVTDILATVATFNATIDEAGTGYYVVVADGSTTPTATEVKAGTGSGGANAIDSGNSEMSANTEKSFSITGLTGDTAYDVYFVAEDSKPNTQTSVTSQDIQTEVPDSTPETFTFTAKTEQDVSNSVTADETVTVAGINLAVDISITNGEYAITPSGSRSLRGGSWTSTAGTIELGDSVQVRMTTSANYGEEKTTTLTIGTESADFKATTKLAELTSLTVDSWNLVSVGNDKIADLSTVESSQYTGGIWPYKSDAWVTDLTSISPKDGFWINPTGTTITFKALGDTSSNLADATAQYAYYKGLDSTKWHLVGVPNSLKWSNIVRNDNITPTTCTIYSGLYVYDVANESWNTTTDIPANSGAWLKHNCPSVATTTTTE